MVVVKNYGNPSLHVNYYRAQADNCLPGFQAGLCEAWCWVLWVNSVACLERSSHD